MPLPELIEIVPLTQPVRAEITVPGSKSITNRALILAALADGEVTLKGALWSEDTQIMVECLKQLGFVVHVAPDPDESCNRTIMVVGEGGLVPRGGTETHPLELFVGNAGTAARFLAPFLCLGSGVYRLHGVPRMHLRPQAALFSALRELGYRVECEFENDKLPARIYGCSSRRDSAQIEKMENSQSRLTSAATKKCRVSIEESSQFASALLLSAGAGHWQVEIVGENADESPYVAMTSKLMEVFPKNGGTFQVEPDASSGSYFWAAAVMVPGLLEVSIGENGNVTVNSKSNVMVLHWPNSGLQIDERFPNFLLPVSPPQINANIFLPPGEFSGFMPDEDWGANLLRQVKDKNSWLSKWSRISRQRDTGDGIMTAITIAPLELQKRHFTDLGRLRVQECERVVALRTELTKCGAKVVEEGDTLTVYPSKPEELHGAEIETYNDHRMAMCFAVLGLKVPGIKIKNPACVKKTFPNFFQKLAAAPPHGLGAEIWEIKNGQRTRKLSGQDLFAD